MPKMKTNSSAKKRFKVTGTGKIKRKHAYKSHILTKKETKRTIPTGLLPTLIHWCVLAWAGPFVIYSKIMEYLIAKHNKIYVPKN